MSQHQITFSSVEDLAMSYATLSTDEWVQNFAHARSEAAINEISQIVVAKCFETGTPVPQSKEDAVSLGFQNGWIKSVAQKIAEQEAARAAAEESQQ
jgi:hypothetical protein